MHYLLQEQNTKIRISFEGGGLLHSFNLSSILLSLSSSLSPPHPFQTGLGPVPMNKCWLALLARWALEDKLPNTGWEQIETERGGCRKRKRKRKKRRREGWFSKGGIAPKGVEVKCARALICNSNEACL